MAERGCGVRVAVRKRAPGGPELLPAGDESAAIRSELAWQRERGPAPLHRLGPHPAVRSRHLPVWIARKQAPGLHHSRWSMRSGARQRTEAGWQMVPQRGSRQPTDHGRSAGRKDIAAGVGEDALFRTTRRAFLTTPAGPSCPATGGGRTCRTSPARTVSAAGKPCRALSIPPCGTKVKMLPRDSSGKTDARPQARAP